MDTLKCSIDTCKRDFNILCNHCHIQVCTKHFIQHVKQANAELIPFSDELNSLVDKIQQQNPTIDIFEHLEQWREESHRRVDEICDEKKRQLKVQLDQRKEDQLKKLLELGSKVKELIDEGDASFKQIEAVKNAIEKYRRQSQECESPGYFGWNKPNIYLDITLFNHELFTGVGTLLSFEHKMKLNEFYGKEGQKWSLIYKATRDGFSATDFYRCCANQGPTITVIQSRDGGYLFGGYTSVSWNPTEKYVLDPNNPFLFTLTNPHVIPPTKYAILIPNYSIYPQSSYGPIFGGGNDLYVCSESQISRKSFFNFPHSYKDTTNRGSATFTGTRNFQTNEIEVYRLMET
ncbi:unnamed protein product [Rotaria socialis]|uniref:TLDc domain-containing protein n=1 Tax=Rotaria socialis TaxID=392032 RepID=A0A818NRD7_9BILA|nr:unnamed protein product [Rotaria socialis]CAF4654284.1 unnamed protein product [Rotaria socialis]